MNNFCRTMIIIVIITGPAKHRCQQNQHKNLQIVWDIENFSASRTAKDNFFIRQKRLFLGILYLALFQFVFVFLQTDIPFVVKPEACIQQKIAKIKFFLLLYPKPLHPNFRVIYILICRKIYDLLLFFIDSTENNFIMSADKWKAFRWNLKIFSKL